VRRIVLLSALLAVAAVAAGQVPQPSQSGVAVSPDAVEARVSVEEASSFQVTVEHTGGLGGFGQIGARQFRVATTDVPAGWLASVEPATFALPPGGTQEVRVTVQVTTDAPSRAEFTIVAQLVPQGAQDIPGAGPVADPDAQDATQVTGTRTEGTTRTLIEGIGPWIYAILLGLLAAVVVIGALVADRRRMAIQLDAPQRELVLGPGGRGSLRLLVQNGGKKDDTVVFHVSDVDPGWASFLPVAELPVRSDHAEELQLIIIAPGDAQPGTRQSIQVQAAGSQRPGRSASITVEAVVGPKPS